MKRSKVSEYFIREYRTENTLDDDCFWSSTSTIERDTGLSNARPSLEALVKKGLLHSRLINVNLQPGESAVNRKTKAVKQYRPAVSWDQFLEAYCKYLSRTRGGKSG